MNVLVVASLLCVVSGGNVVKQIVPKDFPLAGKLRQAKIVNGNQAQQNQFPHQASIRAFSSSSVSICGGSLINKDWILTAGHCTKGFIKFEIGLGSINLYSPTEKLISFTKIEHPYFDSTTLNNDIALIKLPSSVTFTTGIKPVKLPTLASKDAYVNHQVTVSGFGRTSDISTQISSVLHYVLMRVISNSECSAIYGTRVITDNVLCAKGWERNNQNACLGDSGSSIVLNENGDFTQIGIVSFVSSRGCTAGDPSGYTRVDKYLTWINQITGISKKYLETSL